MRESLRGCRSTSPVKGASIHRSPIRHSPVKGGSLDSELMRVLRERDELQNMLHIHERHLSETQANVKVLKAERDKTRILYQQAQEEIAALRRDAMKSKSSRGSKSSLTSQNILKRVEAERDVAISDLNRMTTERDCLRERIKISQETYISERAHLEQTLEDLQAAVLTLEQERGEQKLRHAQVREAVVGLEEEVHTLGRKLGTSEEELIRCRNECSTLRLTNNQMETSMGESQRRLTNWIGELQNTQDRNKILEEKNDTLMRQMSAMQEELNTLRSAVSQLDKERNTLQEQLEKKTLLINTANHQLIEKEHECRELQEARRVESLQTESWEEQARKAETTVIELRLDLHNSNIEIIRLKERADSLENRLQQALSAERSCTSHLSQLNQKIIHMEEDLRQARAEHTQVHTDLEKTRELCVKLDAGKEGLQRELELCRSEMEMLQKQLTSEHLTVQTLESLLVSSRERELQRQLTSQERQTEIEILKDKLIMSDSKANSQSREMAQLKTRSCHLEADLEMTKRHLSTERFERERAVQELRRQGLTAIAPVVTSTMRSSSSPEHSHQSTPDPVPMFHYSDIVQS